MQKSKAKKFILYFTKANRDLKIARNFYIFLDAVFFIL